MKLQIYTVAVLSKVVTAALHGRGAVRLLGEDPEKEVALLPGTEGGGDDDVVARRQTEPGADLAQVDEGLEQQQEYYRCGGFCPRRFFNPA
jgi:hypothetical protein